MLRATDFPTTGISTKTKSSSLKWLVITDRRRKYSRASTSL